MAREYSFNDDDRPKWGAEDPRPEARRDEHAERLESARIAREASRRLQLSGSHDQAARTRSFLDRADFDPIIRRSAVDGRLLVDWEKASAQARGADGRWVQNPERPVS